MQGLYRVGKNKTKNILRGFPTFKNIAQKKKNNDKHNFVKVTVT